jgi:hypothetical protein
MTIFILICLTRVLNLHPQMINPLWFSFNNKNFGTVWDFHPSIWVLFLAWFQRGTISTAQWMVPIATGLVSPGLADLAARTSWSGTDCLGQSVLPPLEPWQVVWIEKLSIFDCLSTKKNLKISKCVPLSPYKYPPQFELKSLPYQLISTLFTQTHCLHRVQVKWRFKSP